MIHCRRLKRTRGVLNFHCPTRDEDFSIPMNHPAMEICPVCGNIIGSGHNECNVSSLVVSSKIQDATLGVIAEKVTKAIRNDKFPDYLK